MTVPFFSVVIAAYNAEKEIEQTMEALLSQTFTDFECIVVDDGSTDRTNAILDGFAARDSRVRVVYQENGGPSSARNRGIDMANGTYLYLLDADDLPEPTLLEQFYHQIEQTDCDLVICGYRMESRAANGQSSTRDFTHPGVSGGDRAAFAALLPELFKEQLAYVCWNKAYRRSIIEAHHIRFSHYRSCEDRLFNLAFYAHVERFSLIEQPLYRYIFRPGNLTNRYLDDKFESLAAFYREARALFAGWDALTEPVAGRLAYLFLKGVEACFVSLSDPSCPLDGRGKRAYVRAILQHGDVRQAAKASGEGGLIPRVTARVIGTRLVAPNQLFAWAIRQADRRANGLYQKLKQKN